MRYLSIIIAIVGLYGCAAGGGDESSGANNYCKEQYSTTYDQVGDSGLLLEPSQNMYVTFNQIEQFYVEVESCMNVIAVGPAVVFKSFSKEGMGGSLGYYGIGTQLLWINTDETGIIERDCNTDKQALKHEFVHHLLHASGTSVEDNKNHNSPFFGICT